jgi:hypothetical protein
MLDAALGNIDRSPIWIHLDLRIYDHYTIGLNTVKLSQTRRSVTANFARMLSEKLWAQCFVKITPHITIKRCELYEIIGGVDHYNRITELAKSKYT